jgi:hypothetical protein
LVSRPRTLLPQSDHQMDGLDELVLTADRQRLGIRQGELKLTR